MINTYHSSGAPPVPPRLHSSHPGARPALCPTTVPPRGHSRTLVRFMVALVLLNLLLSSLGFMYLYTKGAAQREQDLQSSFAGSGPKTSMQKQHKHNVEKKVSHRIFAQMEFLEPNTPPKRHHSGLLKWNIKRSRYSHPYINYYNSSWLTIEEAGDYFVYSRVTFSKDHPMTPLTNRVQRRKSRTHEPETIMQAFCHTVSTLCTAAAEEVIRLEKGNQLSVWTDDVSLVSYEEKATTFGLFNL